MGNYYEESLKAIDTSWNFIDAVKKIKDIREMYFYCLDTFKITDMKKKGEYIHRMRCKIYELDIREWQKELLWSYMNEDVPYKTLISLIKRK